ncbi:MAG: hypothetical protein KF760_11995 [Candidatus Eremiobacteraeota bacterium]|nr:hypothetical protein [Candidatus Eremiobacteraeota bacterium]MCW5868517.1 hypothetical protein [Candidatus Eremiobacteraeota bacterium]
MSFDLWITSNSPGEVSAWVGGVTPKLARLRPDWRVRLALVPCPYASGAEKRVAQQLEGVHEVLSPWETTRWYLGLGKLGWPRAERGLVMFLGGDPWHALLLKRKLGYPVAGYFERPNGWSRFFDFPIYAHAGDPRVGNLMVDRVAPGLPLPRPVLGLFPGSRPWQLRLTLGRYLLVAQELSRRCPQLDFMLVQSPFVQDADLRKALEQPFHLGLPSARARVEANRLVLEGGLEIPKRVGGGAMNDLSLAMTVPGTNTAELACAGIPFVVTLHPLAFLGGGGLAGIIERLPLPSAWKIPLRRRKLRRLRFTALPNQLAGEAIAPEVIVHSSLDPLVEQVQRWVEDPEDVARIRQQLQAVMGQPGATTRLAEWIIGIGDAADR